MNLDKTIQLKYTIEQGIWENSNNIRIMSN